MSAKRALGLFLAALPIAIIVVIFAVAMSVTPFWIFAAACIAGLVASIASLNLGARLLDA